MRVRTRVAGSITACAAVAVLCSCGASQENGPIIGMPPRVDLAATLSQPDTSLEGFEKSLGQQLDLVNLTPTLDESGPLQVEINALLNDPSLLLAERYQALQALGTQAVAARERIISSLVGLVQSSSDALAANIGGQSLSAQLLARLSAANSQLQAIGTKIAGDTLVDVLRTDIISISTITRVNGLLVPMTHLTIAAGAALAGGQRLLTHYNNLQYAIGARSGSQHTYAVSLSNTLFRVINNLQSVAATAAEELLGLSADGFPGNKPVLSSARNALSALRGPNGTFSQALGLISQIRSLL